MAIPKRAGCDAQIDGTTLGSPVSGAPEWPLSPGELRARIYAVRMDLEAVREYLHPAPLLPHRQPSPGGQVAGVVEAIGEGGSSSLLGRWVVASVATGALTRSLRLPESLAVRIPKRIRPEQALTVAANFLPAYQLLHRLADLNEGDRILLLDPRSGLGSALVSLAMRMGLFIYGTFLKGTYPSAEAQRLTPIDAGTRDVDAVIRRKHPKGVHAFFDLSGGGHLSRFLPALRRDGEGFVVESLGKGSVWPPFACRALFRTLYFNLIHRRHVETYEVHRYARHHPERTRKDLRRLLHWLKEGKIQVADEPLLSLGRPDLLAKALAAGIHPAISP
ncbi:MAG: hypothetical protein J0L75_17845 [Spirochaetes bacterium]|nr:hypothetical protein [Spirochaetota bacterium]